MGDWEALEGELGRWNELRLRPTFWWRDDDASEPTRELEKLLVLSERCSIPLALAVIPAKTHAAMRRVLNGSPAQTTVLQHGFGHVNHAPADAKKAEFGDHRPLDVMAGEIAAGAKRLDELLGERWIPAFVPPWNRISDRLVTRLPELGIGGLSTFAPRASRSAAPGLVQVNTHVDLIDWRGSRSFKGSEVVAGEIARHLAARRKSNSDRDEPTGILSHHLVQDEDCWRFLEQLFERTRAGGEARWLTPAQVFGFK